MSTTSRPGAALRDPLVHGEVAPEPVVLRRHVGKRPLAGQLERRHALGLGSLDRLLHGRRSLGTTLLPPMQQPPSASGTQRPLPRPRRRALRLEVGDQLRRGRPGAGDGQAAQGAGPRAGPLRARARDRRRHRLLHAQPAARRRGRRGGGHRHLARHARQAGRAPPRSWGCRSRPSRARRRELPFEDDSFDLVFGHAVLHHLPDLGRPPSREFRRVLRPGRRGRLLRRAVPLRRPPRGLAEARRRARWRRCGGR